jgi:hypothetical protein
MMDDQPLSAADERLSNPAAHLAGLSQSRFPPEYIRPAWHRWAFLAAVVAFVGVLGWWYIVRPTRQNLQLRLSLSSFALLYQAYQRDAGRSPRNIDELEAYVKVQSAGRLANDCQTARLALDRARDGRLHVIWNAWQIWGGSNEYLACESKMMTEGGFVVWTSSRAEYFTAAEFARQRPMPMQMQGR